MEAVTTCINEFVIIDIHLAKVLVRVIQVFSIHVSLSTSNSKNNHIHKLQVCAHGGHTHCNLVDVSVKVYLCLKRCNCTKASKGEQGHSYNLPSNVSCTFPLILLFYSWCICNPLNGLVASNCWICIWILGQWLVIQSSLQNL